MRAPVLVCLMVGLLAACSSGPSHGSSKGASSPASVDVPSGRAADAEQAKSGDAGWEVHGGATPAVIGGYMDPASGVPGTVFHLHARSTRRTVSVAIYRSGYYQGAGGRLLSAQSIQALAPTPAQLLNATTRTETANWPESTPIDTRGWPPGHYLVVLDAAGNRTWVPFTVRSVDVTDRVVILTENTTWQAYNHYGGASLYYGQNGRRSSRSYAVSFNRPIDYGHGAGDYPGNELPLLRLADRLHLPLAFATDTDLEAAPGMLDGARAVVSLGHDEYYSSRMRQQLQHARDSTGTNLAFLGANAVFRHIRLEPLGGSPSRLEVNYKDASLDPVAATDPADATADWPFGPRPRPEDELTGALYSCNPVHGALVVADPVSWLLTGLGLRAGQRLPDLLGSEYDAIRSDDSRPRATVAVFHSPINCGGRSDSADFAYYTVPSGAAGVDVGTSSWVCALDNVCGNLPLPAQTRRLVTQITTRILVAFAAGPAGRAHPLPR
ncbi:MAG: hypothetical protein NVSMB55_07900 [Mycobacteriales bacterium]